MANTKLSWTHDGKNTDGSAIAAADFIGWELKVDGSPSLSVPRSWETDGTYEVLLSELFAGKSGTFALSLSLITKGGQSSFTGPVDATVDFRTPSAPKALAVA
jgi:hypothetical protein